MMIGKNSIKTNSDGLTVLSPKIRFKLYMKEKANIKTDKLSYFDLSNIGARRIRM